MAEIHKKQSIIKKRQTSFKPHTEKGITKKRVLGWLSTPAAYITKKSKDSETRKQISGFISSIAEGSRRFAEAQRKGTTKRRKTTKAKAKRAPKKHRKQSKSIIIRVG